MTRTHGLVAAMLFLAACPLRAADPARPAPSLDDLFALPVIVDVALAPSGRHAAAVLMVNDVFALAVLDLTTGQQNIILRLDKAFTGDKTSGAIRRVAWKSDERLLFWTAVMPAARANIWVGSKDFGRLGTRVFAIDRDGGHIARLLDSSRDRALAGAMDLDDIVSWLPQDPEHVVMLVKGLGSPALFRVNLTDGKGELVTRGTPSTVGWWLDVDGRPTARVQWLGGAFTFWKPEPDGEWKRFLKIRTRDLKTLPDYLYLGASDQPGRFYVLARPENRDRIGVYLFDLAAEAFGEPLIEDPLYDMAFGRVSQDGKKLLESCHIADVWVCQYADPALDAHMKGIRRYFADSANVHPFATASDGRTLLMFVEGPGQVPAFYHYRTSDRQIMPIGVAAQALTGKALPKASIVRWKSRDGLDLSGYLTRPANATEADRLPLVVMPHGGPAWRDLLTFDPDVQYLAARGYAVFQPNFRGSVGFGEAFAKRGDGEWGRRMQDDISDGLLALVGKGWVDAGRVCIVGTSYGGYAALAGATLTPDLYRCAVSIAGISDLAGYLKFRRKQLGTDSEWYQYWERIIGDPKADARRLAAVSPVELASAVKVPVLLMHGTNDAVVPLEQSELMQKALENAGRPTALLRFPGEAHPDWSTAHHKAELIAIDRFLWQHLGPGHGITAPPPEMPAIAN